MPVAAVAAEPVASAPLAPPQLVACLVDAGVVNADEGDALQKAGIDAEVLSLVADDALAEAGISSPLTRGKLIAWGAKWKRGEV